MTAFASAGIATSLSTLSVTRTRSPCGTMSSTIPTATPCTSTVFLV